MPSTDTHAPSHPQYAHSAPQRCPAHTGHCSLARHVVWRTHTHLAIHSTLTALRNAAQPTGHCALGLVLSPGPAHCVPAHIAFIPTHGAAHRHLFR